MKKFKKLFLIMLGIPKSLYFNLKYLGVQGLKLPILLSHRVVLLETKLKES